MAMKQSLELCGLLRNIDFVRARTCAEDIYRKKPYAFEGPPKVTAMLPFDWDTYVESKKRELKGETWQYRECAMTFVNGDLVGGPEDFIEWAKTNHCFEEFRPLPLYITLTEEGFKAFMKSLNHNFVFLDISVDGTAAGRIIVELYSDILPKTCNNFRVLCTGEAGLSDETVMPLTYKNSIFHRVVLNGWIQGGDIHGGRGNGGESIYGRAFEDENFIVKHDRRGLLGMANKGHHTNQSQFYITLQPAPWMDLKYVVFGKIIEGTKTLEKMEDVETMNERPVQEIKITDCGMVYYYDVYDD